MTGSGQAVGQNVTGNWGHLVVFFPLELLGDILREIWVAP